MDIDKVRDDVVKLVEDILDKKALAGLQVDVEEALNEAKKSVSDMADKVAELEVRVSSDSEAIEALEASKNELVTELAAKKDEVVSLNAEKEVLLARVETAESTLETMAKDKLTDDRMADLDGLKIARAGEARDKQALLVREMSDEDFAAYKDDMVAFRDEIAASYKPEEPAAPEAGADNDDLKENASATGDEEDDDVQTPPVDVKGALETASATLPNAETSDNDSKWANFGPGLASYLRERRGEASKDNQ